MLYMLAAVIGVIIVVALGVNGLLAPPATAPSYTGERPTISDDQNSYITHVEEIVIDLPVEQYHQWSSATPLEAVLTETGGIPSVLRTDMVQGTWDQVGARRRVALNDGHFATEEVLVNEQPGLFRYQVWGYTNFARFAVDYAVGEFRFEDVSGKTHIRWTYSFHKNSILSDIFLPNFVQNNWAAYMRNALQTMKRESERSAVVQ